MYKQCAINFWRKNQSLLNPLSHQLYKIKSEINVHGYWNICTCYTDLVVKKREIKNSICEAHVSLALHHEILNWKMRKMRKCAHSSEYEAHVCTHDVQLNSKKHYKSQCEGTTCLSKAVESQTGEKPEKSVPRICVSFYIS